MRRSVERQPAQLLSPGLSARQLMIIVVAFLAVIVMIPVGAMAAGSLVTIVGPNGTSGSQGVAVKDGRLRVGGATALLVDATEDCSAGSVNHDLDVTQYSRIRVSVTEASGGTANLLVAVFEGSDNVATLQLTGLSSPFTNVYEPLGRTLRVGISSCSSPGTSWHLRVYGRTVA